MPFEKLLSAADAARIWNVEPSAIRKAIAAGRLREGTDCKKFGKQWVVTVDGMARAFSHRIGPDYGPWYEHLIRQNSSNSE